ncbi:MAG: ABC transporter ATP-binding protein [Elainellaceae cyanobacterium]
MISSTHPAALKFDEITYHYAGTDRPAVDAMNLAVNPGELVVLVGPSGCGKSTVLKIVAGLIEPNCGRLCIDGMDMIGLPPQQRKIGWVPQSYALFDHLTVAENIAFGLRMHRISSMKRKARTQIMMELCQISDLARRAVNDLSGGQRQRVAIARALAVQPRVLLLDEPLAALDPQLRLSLRSSLVNLLRESGVTTLFVTHDQSEALAIADRIAVMRAGKLEQYGTPETLWHHPTNQFVAQFLSNADVVAGRRIGIRQVEIAPGLVATINPDQLAAHRFESNGHEITLALRPTDIQLDPSGQRVVITATEYSGGHYLARGQVPDGPQLSFFLSQPLRLGATVSIRLRSDVCQTVIES